MGYIKRWKKHLKQSYRDSADKSHELLIFIGNNRANTSENFVTRLFAQYSKILSSVKVFRRSCLEKNTNSAAVHWFSSQAYEYFKVYVRVDQLDEPI